MLFFLGGVHPHCLVFVLFQFSIWDAKCWHSCCCTDSLSRFQFSIWDATQKTAKAWLRSTVSILYLRCRQACPSSRAHNIRQFQFSIWDALITTQILTCYLQKSVSILYLRCSRGAHVELPQLLKGVSILYLRCRNSQNTEDRGRRNTVSILYLRCGTVGIVVIIFTTIVLCFNSLFEMPTPWKSLEL